jgi:putative transposase
LCADFTYLFYEENKIIYLSVIMDLYNREILSYCLSNKRGTHLVLTPLKQLPNLKKPALFHSDQGTEYTSKIIQKTLKEKKLIPSFSEKGSNLKSETIYLEKRHKLTKKRLIQIINTFMKKYNSQRRMKYLKYLSPYQFKYQKEKPTNHSQIIMRVFRVGFLFEYLINNLINKKCLTKKNIILIKNLETIK